MNLAINPLIAIGVVASTAATDAAYVFFNAAVTGRRRVWAANWSAIWYMLSAFAVISYTDNAVYVAFAGAWILARCFYFGDVAASRGASRAVAPRSAVALAP
jgi:hypothetical protein